MSYFFAFQIMLTCARIIRMVFFWLSKCSILVLKKCHRAAESGKLDTIQAISEHGQFVVSRGDDGSYPLHYAAKGGSAKVTTYLLDKGYARADDEDFNGKSALHVAMLYGCPEVVQVLIDYGADVDAIEDRGWHTPLCFGALYSEGPSHLECMHLLGRAVRNKLF